MAIDPSAWNPYNPFGPTGGLFSPFGSYFMPPGQGQQGLSLAPYSQQTWYGFSPWAQGGGGLGAGSGSTPLNLWSLYQQLFPAGNALAGYSFTGAPQPTPPITTAMGPASDAPFPPIPTVFSPPAAPAPAAVPPSPIGTSLTQGGGGGSAAGGVGAPGGHEVAAPGPPETGPGPGPGDGMRSTR